MLRQGRLRRRAHIWLRQPGDDPVHDLLFYENIILDTIGNTDGCLSTYDALFGFGLYIDNYSRDVTISSNTIISSTASGILYQNSTGSITANTLYNNSRGSMYSAQINLTSSPTYVASQTNNVLYSLRQNAWTLATANRDRIGVSDYNYFFNPYLSQSHLRARHQILIPMASLQRQGPTFPKPGFSSTRATRQDRSSSITIPAAENL